MLSKEKLPDNYIKFYRARFVIEPRKRFNSWAFWGWVCALITSACFWGVLISLILASRGH